METKIFLQGFNSKKSVNTSEGLNMSLKGKRRLLPTNDIGEVISQYDQYSKEREDCNIIRLTCQVNPICSNVLFNRISEIVKDEGSDDVTVLNYGKLGDKYSGVVSDKILYKTKDIEFWSGTSMTYQSVDDKVTNLSKSVSISLLKEDNYNTVNPDGHINAGVAHPTNAIRDMQLSNDNYVYHCGLDILNNHLIRSNTFKCVCKFVKAAEDDMNFSKYTAFNTIADLMRDCNGRKVVEKLPFPVTANVPDNAKFVAMHLYEYDDILSFDETVKQRLINKYNGWVGFNNKPKIKSYEIPSVKYNNDREKEKEMEIERPIMYMNGGDFVDMYPDRTLYSFVPKYNEHRNRFEKNWNYCLTYPSSSTTQGFEDIIERSNNSLKALYFNENTRADNGTKQLVIYSIAKHGLNVGDFVNIYNNTLDGDGKTVNTKILDNAEVTTVVDDYIFVVFNADTQISKFWVELTDEELDKDSITLNGVTFNIDTKNRKVYYKGNDRTHKYFIVNDNFVNFDDDAQNISYKKTVGDIECEYYVRIFSKIPNFKNASADTSNEYEIYKNNGELINIYQGREYDFESHVSRLAFAKNIYSDEVGELVFTDDIDISKLKDNLGRPLSSIYLTIVKNNKGYKEWYGFDNKEWTPDYVDAERVEFSHCFGKVSCGIETCDESSVENMVNSIYKINNNDLPFGYDVEILNGRRSYEVENLDTYDVKVEYLESDGTQYIDLGGYSGTSYTISVSGTRCTVIIDNTSYLVNGTTAITPSNNVSNIRIFDSNGGRISALTITENNAVVKDFEPVVEGGKAKMYEMIGRKSFTKKGDGGELIPGPPIIEETPQDEEESEETISVTNTEVFFDSDKHYFGDLSYYDAYNAIERHIQPIMHRFNTAQRESSNTPSGKYFFNMVYDEITNDDYDKGNDYKVQANIIGDCNNKIEGYYYIPHYEIPIKTFDKLETVMPDFLIMRSLINTDKGAKITTMQNHFLSIGDKAMIYDMAKNKYYYCTTVQGDKDTYRTFTCKIYDENGNEVLLHDLYGSYSIEEDDPNYNSDDDIMNFKLFKIDNLDIPSYARILKDGSCRFIWRDILNNGFNLSDKSVEEYPFTNGAFYVNKRVDLYVRRQDPYDMWGMYSDDDIIGNDIAIEKIDNYVKEDEIVC